MIKKIGEQKQIEDVFFYQQFELYFEVNKVSLDNFMLWKRMIPPYSEIKKCIDNAKLPNCLNYNQNNDSSVLEDYQLQKYNHFSLCYELFNKNLYCIESYQEKQQNQNNLNQSFRELDFLLTENYEDSYFNITSLVTNDINNKMKLKDVTSILNHSLGAIEEQNQKTINFYEKEIISKNFSSPITESLKIGVPLLIGIGGVIFGGYMWYQKMTIQAKIYHERLNNNQNIELETIHQHIINEDEETSLINN